MPKFLDHHKAVDLPPAMVQQLVSQIKSGKADANGIRPINDFIGKNGEGWCFVEAPNADVVHKLHESMGIKLAKGDIVEVTTLV